MRKFYASDHASWLKHQTSDEWKAYLYQPGRNRRHGDAEERIGLLAQVASDADHVIWADDLSAIEELSAFERRGHRLVADAYRLTLAIEHGGRLATFDRGTEWLQFIAGVERVVIIA